MTEFPWQLKTPINTLIFDCDGTLSQIEGIDELAEKNGSREEVIALTDAAMGRLGMNVELYEKRLQLVNPTESDVIQLADHYYRYRVPDVEEVMQIFNRLNKNLFIVSAGLLPAVARFGEKLQIPKENIIAVNIHFNEMGKYIDFDRASPLVTSTGKRIVISHIKAIYPEIIFVGDGLNDMAAYDLANRFIGYGGAFYREKIAEQCQLYIRAASLTALLPLTLTYDEYASLNTAEKDLYQKGLLSIEENQVEIN